MKVNRLTTLGAGLLLAGLAVMGTMFGYGVYPAAAGEQTATPESTPTTCGVQIDALAVQQACPSATQVKLKTHTPTSTATAAATTTSAPTSTSAPSTNTPVPATQAPTGGQEGAGVRPPNTGSGDGTSGGTALWVIVLGAALLASGAGTFVMGVRRR